MGVNTIQLYLGYNTKERNTTIGMPELMEVQIAKQKQKAAAAAAMARRNNRSSPAHHNRASSSGSTVESAWDESPPAAPRRGNTVTFAGGVEDGDEDDEEASEALSPNATRLASSIHFSAPEIGDEYDEIRRNESEEYERHFNELANRGMLASAIIRMPERERLHLGEDVYAFVFACPFLSVPFWFAIYFICTKYTIFLCMLSTGIERDGEYPGPWEPSGAWASPCDPDRAGWTVQAVKFLLIPVVSS